MISQKLKNGNMKRCENKMWSFQKVLFWIVWSIIFSIIVWLGYEKSFSIMHIIGFSIGKVLFIWIVILIIWGMIFSLLSLLSWYSYKLFGWRYKNPSIREIGIIILVGLLLSLISFPHIYLK